MMTDDLIGTGSTSTPEDYPQPGTREQYTAALLTLLEADPEEIRKAAKSMGIAMQEAADNLAAAFREVHWWEAADREWSVVDEPDE